MKNKVLEFKSKDQTGKEKINGKMVIKNETEESADLYFYGDIRSTSYDDDSWWSSGNPEDRAPQDVADFLNQLEGTNSVNLHINSGGGDVFAGIAIYNILKNSKANITTYVEGLAASSASLIAFAGDKVVVPKSAQLMVHNPWTIAMGNANDFRDTADMLDQIAKSILNIYMDNVQDGVEEETIKTMMDNETWLTGEEALEYFSIEVDDKLSVAASVDSEYFSKYKHIPKNLVKDEPKPPENSNSLDEVMKAIKGLNSRIDKIEDSTKKEDESKNNEEIQKLKAKMALKMKI